MVSPISEYLVDNSLDFLSETIHYRSGWLSNSHQGTHFGCLGIGAILGEDILTQLDQGFVSWFLQGICLDSGIGSLGCGVGGLGS